MKRPAHGATLKQYAYAKKLLNAEGRSKKDIALSVGYSESVAKNVETNIESSEGFQNAVIALSAESNNLVMSVMAEYKARGLKNFSNTDLNGALNAIAKAWEKFNTTRAPNGSNLPVNPIKQAIIQRIQNQTINISKTDTPVSIPNKDVPDLDF